MSQDTASPGYIFLPSLVVTEGQTEVVLSSGDGVTDPDNILPALDSSV